jgi:predicted secreted protein
MEVIMAKQKGRLLLVKIGTGSGPVTYGSLCGLNTRTVKFTSGDSDVTTGDCTDENAILWRSRFAGIREMMVSGNGFFENPTQFQLLLAAKLTGNNIVPLEITWPTVGVFTADFSIGDLSGTGDLEGAITQEMEFMSDGAVAFVPAA